MAEQKATAKYLVQKEAVDSYLDNMKKGLEERLWAIYNGIIALKEKGYPVDAVAPQAAIYLTIKIDLKGMQSGDTQIATQADVTEYLLSEAKLAIVPFYAFGADKSSPWYRLSIGTCKMEDIQEMLGMLEASLQKLMVLS
jgi:aspartate aminotransferase